MKPSHHSFISIALLVVAALVVSHKSYQLRTNPSPAIIADKTPILVEEGYHGYNIVRYNGLFYGLSQAEGALDVENIKTTAKLPWFSGALLDVVKAEIMSKGSDKTPILVVEGYYGYNIVRYNGLFYGVSQAEGALNIENVQTSAKLQWFSDTSLEPVKSKIALLKSDRFTVFSRIIRKIKSLL